MGVIPPLQLTNDSGNIATVTLSNTLPAVTANTGGTGLFGMGGTGGGGGLGSIGSGISSIFGGAASLIQAGGDRAEAQAYQESEQIALQNKQITQESTGVQLAQAQRQIQQTIGQQKADVAGAGMTSGGTAQYLLKSSVSQGALSTSLISMQGAINENAYQQEADAAQGMASAANSAATAADVSGAGQILGGIAGIFGM